MKDIKTFNELMKVSNDTKKRILDIITDLECEKSEFSKAQLHSFINKHLENMHQSVQNGMNSKESSFSKISGKDAHKLDIGYHDRQKSAFNPLLQNVLKYSIAIIEENHRMGKIVACPTAGSCGILPATIIAYSEEYGFSKDKQMESLIIAGGVGKIIAEQVALAGAVAGCQAECGVASSMAASATTYLMDGDDTAIINAAALALKNVLGLVCDPVAGLVEVPCIKRNGFFAIHAITASEMALNKIESVIPLDEVVTAMKQIGTLMSPLLKECSEAGLATTPTAKKIQENLNIK